MGFFSYNCLGCGHSIRSANARHAPQWMIATTQVLPLGQPIQGYYDGYGRIVTDADREIAVEVFGGEAGLYHTACWELSGRPGFTRRSRRAGDQGFFCDSSPSEPQTYANMVALKKMRR
jgi:hypothetical protein